jgi:DNA-binding MarR family transcriptional regulator
VTLPQSPETQQRFVSVSMATVHHIDKTRSLPTVKEITMAKLSKAEQQQLIDEFIKDEMARSIDPGEWFQFRKQYLRFLNLSQAVILSWLVGQLEMYIKRRETGGDGDINGWFYARTNSMVLDTGIEKRTQMRILSYLESNKFIERQTCSETGRRYIWVNLLEISKALHKKRTKVTKFPSWMEREATDPGVIATTWEPTGKGK